MFPFSLPSTAEGWQNITLVFTVIAFTIAFAISATNAALTWKVNKVKKEESQRKDDQLARDLKDKDLQIENVRAESDVKIASVQAEADKKIAGVEAEANRKIEEARNQADIKIAEASKEAARANKQAEELKAQNLALQSQIETERRTRLEREWRW